MQAWIASEAATADFGDKRLNERFGIVLDQLSEKPSLSIPAACGGDAETAAAYRFFANDRVDAEQVLKPHRDATLLRIRAQKVVLIVQDTTEIDVTRKEERVGGPLNDPNRWGLFDHALVALTPERVPLGSVRADIWSRDPDEFDKPQEEKRRERRSKSIEEKESYRWLEGYRCACEIAEQAPETKIISVSDSEGDIYECFAEPAQGEGKRKAEFIVRACQDRAVKEEVGHLFQVVACSKRLGTLKVQVGKREATTGDDRRRKQARKARQAKVTVRAVRVWLRPPSRKGVKLSAVYVNAILVREEKPPADEEPIEWLLLTSLGIDTFQEVCQVVAYYCCRWGMEIYFRVLKGGCRIEKLQLEEEERLRPCIALYMIVAWRVMFVMMLGRKCPKMPCDAVLSEDEWKSVYRIVENEPLPRKPPSLGKMIELIASLGGWLGRKCDGSPGPQTMWIGIQRMRDFATAWKEFGPARGKKLV